jgi:hypothetical protein
VVVVDAGLEDDVEGGSVVKTTRYVVEEVEEEVLPLVQREWCSKAWIDTSSLVPQQGWWTSKVCLCRLSMAYLKSPFMRSCFLSCLKLKLSMST